MCSSDLSPLYSVNTGLDSFILFNDETFTEEVSLTDLMANREEEEDNTELLKIFSKSENYNKLNPGLELQIIRPFLLNIESQESNPKRNEKPKELKQIQCSVSLQEQSESALVEEDSNQTAEPESSPLWSMKFDGSCTRRNVGVGV